jgi:hypothetical protein
MLHDPFSLNHQPKMLPQSRAVKRKVTICHSSATVNGQQGHVVMRASDVYSGELFSV